MTDYRFDDDGAFGDRWEGLDEMMSDPPMKSDNAIRDLAGSYTYARNHNRLSISDTVAASHNDEQSAAWGNTEEAWDREQTPNTRTPAYATPYTYEQGKEDARMGRDSRTFLHGTPGDWSAYAHGYNDERERHTPTQTAHKTFWGRVSEALLSGGWF